MNSINSAAVGPESAFRSWVDQPTSTTLVSGHGIVRGWCFHRHGQRITGVRARIGPRVFEGSYGGSRPDVAAAFAGEPAGDQAGYEIAVSFPAGGSTCQLEARIGAGAWQEFQSFRVTAPDRGWRERLNWAAFWIDAWLGRPGRWAKLTDHDREFAVAWARNRGWTNLQLAPQYPPRPVTPERFGRSRTPATRLPQLSIVTPSYNQAPFLEATLHSVLDQRDVRIEYIVQDGGSTDGSVDILKRHAARLKHWESARDHGQADAIVRGFAHSEGGPDDVMMYLNSDDLLMPGAARWVAEYFHRHPDVDVLYGHRVLIDDDGLEVGRWYSPRRQCDDFRMHDLVPQETLFWRRRAWDRVGGIDPNFHFAMDWDLLLRFAAAGAKYARVPRFLGLFRLHAQQKSQAQLEARGIPEMDQLRQRTLGRVPTPDELRASMGQAQLDSALVHALAQRGIRV